MNGVGGWVVEVQSTLGSNPKAAGPALAHRQDVVVAQTCTIVRVVFKICQASAAAIPLGYTLVGPQPDHTGIFAATEAADVNRIRTEPFRFPRLMVPDPIRLRIEHAHSRGAGACPDHPRTVDV